jgi:hypothetical protein
MVTTLTDRPIADVPTRPRPLRLTDEQMSAILRGATAMHPHDRGAYLQTVASLLAGCEIGDGSVARAVAAAQRHHRRPPDLSGNNHVSRWARRGGGVREKAD